MILSNIRHSDWLTEEKALNRNDVNCINSVVAIYISSLQRASYENSNLEEMPLGGDHINGVDPRGGRLLTRFGRGDGVGAARGQRRKVVVAGAVGQG